MRQEPRIKARNANESQRRVLRKKIPNEKSATSKKNGRFLDKLDTEGTAKRFEELRSEMTFFYVDRKFLINQPQRTKSNRIEVERSSIQILNSKL